MPLSVLPVRRAARIRLVTMLLLGSAASAQTTAPATPAPAPAPTAPAPATPAAAGAKVVTSGATARATSALAVELSGALKGKFIDCPAALKLSTSAVCLYVKTPATSLRPLIKGRLAARAVTDWKSSGKVSSLLIRETASGAVNTFLVLTSLTEQESLLSLDAVQARASAPAVKVPTPAGVTKGEPYVLGSDLAGVVTVTSVGGGRYTLQADGASGPLTVTVGQRRAQVGSGTVELPLAPATDGKNLIFPLGGLSALSCTLTPAGTAMTVACGKNSVGLKPIVF